MDGRDAQCHSFEGHAEPGVAKHGGERLGLGEGPQRARQVAIGLAVGAEQHRDRRRDALEIEGVEPREQPTRRMRKLEHDRPATGTKYPPEFRERASEVADVADGEAGHDPVDARVGQR